MESNLKDKSEEETEAEAERIRLSDILKQIELQEADDIEIKQQFGSFVGSLAHRSRLPIDRQVFFVSLFYIRRIVFVFIVIAPYEYPVIQIFGLILL